MIRYKISGKPTSHIYVTDAGWVLGKTEKIGSSAIFVRFNKEPVEFKNRIFTFFGSRGKNDFVHGLISQSGEKTSYITSNGEESDDYKDSIVTSFPSKNDKFLLTKINEKTHTIYSDLVETLFFPTNVPTLVVVNRESKAFRTFTFSKKIISAALSFDNSTILVTFHGEVTIIDNPVI